MFLLAIEEFYCLNLYLEAGLPAVCVVDNGISELVLPPDVTTPLLFTDC